MKKIFLFVVLCAFYAFPQNNSSVDTLFIASWNVENLFDTIDDPEKKDEDFLPDGRNEWTEERLEQKYQNLVTVISSFDDGNGPDILGLEEVENADVVNELVKRLNKELPERYYIIAHNNSPDKRGIDCSMLIDQNKFSLLNFEGLYVELPDKWPTRDILHARVLVRYNNSELNLFVNHWPSRYGGEEKSRPNRNAAAATLSKYFKENNYCTTNKNIIIMGDFNDETDNMSTLDILGAKPNLESAEKAGSCLVNLAAKFDKDGLGSYLYRGNWNMLDQIMVSKEVLNESGVFYLKDSFSIVKNEIMVTQSGKYKGAANPTFGGKKYLGGYSDHFPVAAKFIIRK